MSFTITATPVNLRIFPVRTSRSHAAASPRTSGFTTTTLFSPVAWSYTAIRRKYSSTIPAQVTRPASNAPCVPTTVASTTSNPCADAVDGDPIIITSPKTIRLRSNTEPLNILAS